MSGSLDDHQVKVVNATDETVLTAMVFPNGSATILSNQPPEWVATALRQMADSYAPGDQTLMDADVPTALIETVRTEIDGMVSDLKQAPEPLTTAQIIQMFGQQKDLTNEQHRQALATTAAILLQRAVYA